jgi:uncharacterized protein
MIAAHQLRARVRNARHELVPALLAVLLVWPLLARGEATQIGVTRHTEWARMRDGVLLASEVHLPAPRAELPAGSSPERYPVVLLRNPYNAGTQSIFSAACEQLAARGYAVVEQEVRGTSRSHGTFRPFHQERNDGYDAVEWAAAQPWSNGKVGLWGASYLGATALLAATTRPPHLVAVVAAITASDYHDNWTYVNGVFDQWFAQSWVMKFLAKDAFRRERVAAGMSWAAAIAAAQERGPRDDAALLPEGVKRLPLQEFADFGASAPYYREWLAHPHYDAYWKDIDLEGQYERIAVPVLSIGGWYDIFSVGSVRNFIGLRRAAGSIEAREGSRLVMAPICHGTCNEAVKFANAPDSLTGLSAGWWDFWLKGIDRGRAAPPVQLFVMEFPERGDEGSGFWISADEYPLTDTPRVRFALRSGGHANSVKGDGSLDAQAPASGPPDRFTYDPADPVPTLGGNLCCAGELLEPGVFDQAEIELRDDVLVYSSPPLLEDLVVVGPVFVNFWAASSAPDTDFTAKLLHVRPDGVAFNLLDRVVNARLRRGSKLPPVPTIPGRAYEYRLELGHIANVFKAGQRIRLEISSSNFPHFARNLNTGRSAATDHRSMPARQTIHHDSLHASYLELPVPGAVHRAEVTDPFDNGNATLNAGAHDR